MENAHVVKVYDFLHKNYTFMGSDISHWLNTSITCTPKGWVHPACEPQIYRVKKSKNNELDS